MLGMELTLRKLYRYSDVISMFILDPLNRSGIAAATRWGVAKVFKIHG